MSQRNGRITEDRRRRRPNPRGAVSEATTRRWTHRARRAVRGRSLVPHRTAVTYLAVRQRYRWRGSIPSGLMSPVRLGACASRGQAAER